MADEDTWYQQNTNMIHGEQMIGLYKGYVVDNRDPWGKGRVRIWCYQLHGDFTKVPKQSLKWVEPIIPLSGSFTPPPLWSRVWFGFDAGHKYTWVYLGYWYGIPNGKGFLPVDSGKGTEVPAEAWHFHDLTPEVIMLARSAEGNAVWMEQKFVGDNHVASSINLMDTGGKAISIKSVHKDTGNFESSYKTDSDKTLTADSSLPPGEPIRSGTDVDEQVTGFIELEHQNLKRNMISDSNDFTVDQVAQYKGGTDLMIESQMINGEVLLHRARTSHLSAANDSLFLHSDNNVFVNNFMTPPRRYDG